MIWKEEVVLIGYDEADDKHPTDMMYSNGAQTFYKLKKRTRDEIAVIMGVNEKV